MEMTVTQFKAHCLRVVEKVQQENASVVITKHGQPAAELVPVHTPQKGKLFGRTAGTAEIIGDIIHNEHEAWDAES